MKMFARWALRLEDTQVRDEGSYECQVTTAIKTSSIVHLKVLGKYSWCFMEYSDFIKAVIWSKM